MEAKFTAVVSIDIPKNLENSEDMELWNFAAAEYHRLMTPYVPFCEGVLSENVKISAGRLFGEIEYISPYARYIYEGVLMVGEKSGNARAKRGERKVKTSKKLKIKTVRHPLASSKWDKAAEPCQKPKLISAMEAYR